LTVVEFSIGPAPAGAAKAPFYDGLVSSTFSRRNKGLVLQPEAAHQRDVNGKAVRCEPSQPMLCGDGPALSREPGLCEASFMYEMFTEFIRSYVAIDSDSLTILLVMIGWSALLLHLGLESRLVTAMFLPGMFLGGLAAFALARNGYLPLFAAKEMQAVAVSVIGIIAGFTLSVLVIQAVHWFKEWRRPLTLEDRV
jgi:hypothetical protein